MKKSIVYFVIALLVNSKSFSQPFLGLGATNKGALIQLGYLANKTEITAGYTAPFTSNENAKILSLQVGRQILLSHNDEDNYSFTPYIGAGYLRYQDFTLYDSDPTGKSPIIDVKEFKPVAGIEIGKDSYLGRIFLSGSYCKTFYFGMGIKMFPYRN